MENINNNFESPDPWRQAILEERKHIYLDPLLEQVLENYEGSKDTALVLGDASLVQSSLLCKKGFKHIVDVDSSPSLMDDDIVSITDHRVERVLSEFDQYHPKGSFDLIYGKSIAFNPKETTPKLLQTLSEALTENGILYAVWGGEGDSFRENIVYSLEELERLYAEANLKITRKVVRDNNISGLLELGRAHTIKIVAKRK